jgi:hypothetical protein
VRAPHHSHAYLCSSVHVQATAGDPDMFVSQTPYDRPVLTNHTWSGTAVGSDVLTIPFDVMDPSSAVFVGVTGYGGPASFSVQCSVVSDVGSELDGVSSSGGGGGVSSDDSSRVCEHCGASVPVMSYDRHVAFCGRNNVRCSVVGCGKRIRRGEEEKHVHCGECGHVGSREDIEKHVVLWHREHECECGVRLKLSALVEHVRSVCEKRVIECRFCGGRVTAGKATEEVEDVMMGLSGHEAYCGSKSRSCPICRLRFPLKRLFLHSIEAHGADVVLPESTPLLPHDEVPVAHPPVPDQHPHLTPQLSRGDSRLWEASRPSPKWSCRFCSFDNVAASSYCSVCESPKDVATMHLPGSPAPPVLSSSASIPTLRCTSCTFDNAIDAVFCVVCRSRL